MGQVTSVPAASTEMTFRRIVFPGMLNANQIAFGGEILSFYDECSGIIGLNYRKGNLATVAIDDVSFTRPVRNGDVMVVRGRVVYAGRTSFSVRMWMDVEKNGEPLGPAGGAVYHYVALDEAGKPAPVPELLLETEEDRLLWKEAQLSRDLKKKRAELLKESVC